MDFHVIAESISDAIILIDYKGRVIYWNPASEKLFGYSEKEVMGKELHQLIIPSRFYDDYRRGFDAFRLTGQGPIIGKTLELLALRKDGIEFPVEVSLSRVLIQGMWHGVGILRDISERKEAERQRQDTNRLLKMFTQNATQKEFLDTASRLIKDHCGCHHAGIRILDAQGNIPFESFDGYSVEFMSCEGQLSIHNDQCVCIRAIMSQPDRQEAGFFTANGSYCYQDFVKYISKLDEIERVRYRGVCAEKGFRSIAGIPIRYHERILGLIHLADEREGIFSQKIIEFMETLSYIIGEAITKYKAQEDLARLASAAESAADAIVITDNRGYIQYVNPAFEHITGYKRDEVINRNIHILDSGEQGEDFFHSVRDILKQDNVWKGRLVNKKKDGTTYHEECTISAVRDSRGGIMNYVAIKRDVTERIRLESVAQAVNTMNNMGYIFSGIRHEIGNPVNSIKMTLSMLKENLGRFDQRVIQGYLECSIDEIRRIEYLLKAFKNFNMYEHMELKDIDMKSFMDKLLTIIRDDFLRRGISVSLYISPVADHCYADPRALHQVMLNILINAGDACNGRKDPFISVSLSRSADNMVNIQVKDNGCGMTDDQMKNLFKPFFTTKSDGTGLGLVIAKKMVALMNGTIEVESKKDKGTIVNILLPRGPNA